MGCWSMGCSYATCSFTIIFITNRNGYTSKKIIIFYIFILVSLYFKIILFKIFYFLYIFIYLLYFLLYYFYYIYLLWNLYFIIILYLIYYFRKDQVLIHFVHSVQYGRHHLQSLGKKNMKTNLVSKNFRYCILWYLDLVKAIFF